MTTLATSVDTLTTRGTRNYGAAGNPNHIETLTAAPTRDLWDECIELIRAWSRSTHDIDEDEYDPPTPIALNIALELGRGLALRNVPPPTRVAPTGDGGVVFERFHPPVLETLEVGADGEAVLSTFRNATRTSQFVLRT